jgi:hypothetical protein
MSRPRYRWTGKQIAQAKKLWAQGKASHEIYRVIGVTHDCFNYARKYGLLKGLPNRGRGGKGVKQTNNHTPSRQEIEKHLQAFQEKWTDEERDRRRYGYLGPGK